MSEEKKTLDEALARLYHDATPIERQMYITEETYRAIRRSVRIGRTIRLLRLLAFLLILSGIVLLVISVHL